MMPEPCTPLLGTYTNRAGTTTLEIKAELHTLATQPGESFKLHSIHNIVLSFNDYTVCIKKDYFIKCYKTAHPLENGFQRMSLAEKIVCNTAYLFNDRDSPCQEDLGEHNIEMILNRHNALVCIKISKNYNEDNNILLRVNNLQLETKCARRLSR